MALFIIAWGVVSAADHGTAGRFAIELLSGTAVGIAWWASLRRAEGRLPWILISTGLTCWFIGDLSRDGYLLSPGEVPSLSVADVLYLGAYPLLAGGLAAMISRRSAGRWKDGCFDAIGVAAVASLACWQYLIDTETGSLFRRTVFAADPLADAVLLAMLAWLVFSPGKRSASTWLLATGVAWWLAVGIELAINGVVGSSWAHIWWNSSYPLAYLLVALGLAHVSSVVLAAPDAKRSERLHPSRVAFLGLALFGAPTLAIISDDRTSSVSTWEFLSVTIAIGCLVLARFAGALREVEDARQALGFQAHHDPLTGLFNRAALMGRLTASLVGARRSGRPLVVLYIDLDRFKPINDTLGHGAGDELLRQVGDRLNGIVSADAVVARPGECRHGDLPDRRRRRARSQAGRQCALHREARRA